MDSVVSAVIAMAAAEIDATRTCVARDARGTRLYENVRELVPHILACAAGLLELDLRDHWINHEVVSIMAALTHTSVHTLTRLDLNCCNIKDPGAELVAEFVNAATALAVLDVGTNCMTHVGATRVLRAVANSRTLASLNYGFSHTGMTTYTHTAVVVQALVTALAGCATLTELGVHGQYCDDAMAVALAEYLCARPARMTRLNFLRGAFGIAGWAAVTRIMKHSHQTMRDLAIGLGCFSRGADAQCILLAPPHCAALTTLSVHGFHPQVSADFTREVVFATLLRATTTLRDLDLDCVRFSATTCELFTSALAGNTSLVRLAVGGVSQCAGMGTMMAGALRRNKTLVELKIDCIDVDRASALAFCDVLRPGANTTLTKLNVSYHSMTEAGVWALAAMLRRRPQMEVMDVSGRVTEATHAVAAALRRCAENRKLLAFAGAFTPQKRPRTAAGRFVRADGDCSHAHRVAEFLVGGE